MSFIFHPGENVNGVLLGGKAAALAALQNKGLAIPDWFVVLPHAFECGFSKADRQLFHSTPNYDEFFSGLNLAPAFVTELNAALAKLCPDGELVAARSSALDEDGRDHSFAGQLESFLSVSRVDIFAKIMAVWKSGFSSRVQAYREQHQLSGTLRPPAVLIQRMVQAECAGVAFGADPISGRTDLVVVSGVAGLGDKLVNGESDADTWRVDSEGKIVERELSKGAEVGGPVLNDKQVCAIAEMVRRTGEIFGRPQDIEWAIEKGCVYLLQSRPITTLGNSPPGATLEKCKAVFGSFPQPRGELNIWDNSNIIESYSGVTTPLTFSFARRAYEGVYRQFCEVLAVPKSRIAAHDETFRQMLGLIRGRVYYNLLNWYRVLALLPGFTLNRRFMEQMMGVKEELPAEIVAEIGQASATDRWKDALAVAGSLLALAANHFLLPRKIRNFYQRLETALASPEKPLETMSAKNLTSYFLELERKLLKRWDAPLLNDFFAMIFFGVLRRLITNWAGDADGTLQNDLLCAEGGMISAEPARRIRELAHIAAKSEVLVEQLCHGAPAFIFLALEQHGDFKAACHAYLVKFGDRCLEELKLESLTLHDDPLLLFRSVGQLARTNRLIISRHFAEQVEVPADTRREAETKIEQSLAGNPMRRILFHWVLRHTRARVRDRENLRFERTRLFGRVRRIFVELGRRLHEEKHIDDARDIFYLEIDEVFEFLRGNIKDDCLKKRIVERKRVFAQFRATPAPPDRLTTHGVVNQEAIPSAISVTASNNSNQRKGIGCCPGIVRGRVRKISDPRDAVIHAGEILVAERTDPGWIMLFPSAAGLLVERGSLLSHSAIVARELRLPAIVSIEGLMAWLQNGDEVEFDGSNGVVSRLFENEKTSFDLPSSPVSMPAPVLSINTAELPFTSVAP